MKIIDYRALARDVLVVLTQDSLGEYSAYVGAVDGLDHEAEKFWVGQHGAKIELKLAIAIFKTHELTIYNYRR